MILYLLTNICCDCRDIIRPKANIICAANIIATKKLPSWEAFFVAGGASATLFELFRYKEFFVCEICFGGTF
jgi:hypothetical protein